MPPEAMMTETPVHAPLPPRTTRNAAIMTTATTVGIMPKNNPETASRTDRVSKMMPVTKVQGISMTQMPMAPMARPVITCRIQVLDSRRKIFSRS